MAMEKEDRKGKMEFKVKADDSKIRNGFHFEVQRRTRANVFRNKKRYTRKTKHKIRDYTEGEN